MVARLIFVFDSSPLVASCQFAVGRRAVADIALTGAYVQIPPAVYPEVVTQAGSRPDAMKAAELIDAGYIPRNPTGFVPQLDFVHVSGCNRLLVPGVRAPTVGLLPGLGRLPMLNNPHRSRHGDG
jgi:hypothetical protein